MKINILIDSGNCKNIGDNAMLVNLVNTLAAETEWNFFVIDKNVDMKFDNHNNRVKFVANSKGLLKMPYWRINCDSGKLWLLLFLFLFGIKIIFLYINIKFYRKLKFHIVPSKSIKLWTEIFNNTDGYWVAGGGNINDMGLGGIICKMTFAKIYTLLNKPAIFSGQTIGPINQVFSKLVVKEGIKNINLLSLREKESYRILEKLGCDLDNVYITADDALTLEDKGAGSFNVTSKKIILLNFRFAFYSTQNYNLLNKYALLIDRMLNIFLNEDFLFVPLAFGRDDSDIETAEKILCLLKDRSNRIKIYKGNISYENVQSLIKKACLSIGVSYHFCLFSLSNGVPTIGLYANDFYAQKLNGLMEMFGQEGAALNLTELDIDSLIQAIKHFYSNFSNDTALQRKKKMEEKWYYFMRKSIEKIETSFRMNKIVKDKFNICIVSSSLEHVTRGVESWAKETAYALKDKGLYARLYKGSGPKRSEIESVVPCLRGDSKFSISLHKTLPKFSWRFGMGSSYQIQQTTFALSFVPEIIRRNFDIIHTQDAYVANILRIANKIGLIKARVILGHGTEESFDFIKKFPYLQHLAPYHMKEAVSKGVNGTKHFAIPNFVDTDKFSPEIKSNLKKELNIPGNAFVVLSVAAIKKAHKRIDYLIDEAGRLNNKNIYIVIAGSRTGETNELIGYGRQKLGDRVRFLTDLSHNRMNEVYAIADVFTLCSLKEMMPIALLEALSAGIPSIVNKYPVLEWMIGKGGEAIDMAKEGELANTITKYIDERYKKEKSLEAREQALNNFSKDVVVTRIIDMYKEVLK